MSTAIQRSFSGGEVAPSIYARVDQIKYATGARTLRNFMVMRHGGAQNRPGTGFVAEVWDSSRKVRLVRFVFNAAQTYQLEFGHLYMRVIKYGVQLTDSTKTITGITQASPAVVTAAAHGFITGDEVFIQGVVGMTEVNGRNFKVTVLSPSTFSLQLMDGTTDLDSTGFTAYSSGGQALRVFEIATPYVEADLATLDFVQSADVITLTHPNYHPRDLSRTGDTSWDLDVIDFAPTIGRPNGGTATKGPAGSKTFRYRVTALKEETLEQSLTGREVTKAISGATQANPVVITTGASHGYSNGDEVYIEGIVGMVELNERKFKIANVTATTFELVGEDGTGHTAYSSGGISARTFLRINSAGDPTVASPHVLSWTAVAGAQEYNVFREINGIYGFIGTAGENSFHDDGISDPDTTDTPPIERNPFDSAGNYPSTVTYFQQRRTFGNTYNDPEKAFASKTGSFTNFSISSPLQADDAVTWNQVGAQVNAIKHMIDLGGLVIFTTGGEWTAEGDVAGILKPGEVNPRQISYYGSGDLRPIIVGNTALFIQGRGSIVRDLGFDFEVDNFKGNDLTIFSAHLFDNFTIVDWAFQQIPHSVVWAVRSDGVLLGLTYIREHQVWGWHRHDFDGFVENVSVVPEGTEDVLYLVIKRTVNGKVVRYIERMKTRQITDIVDAVFMDSALSFDGRNTGATTMTLSGGVTWKYTEIIDLTASGAFFSASDVGNEIQLTDPATGDVVRFRITSYTSPTAVKGKPNRTVPASLRSVAITDWAKAVDEISGLWHLEGKQVSVFADGFVIVNPNNEPDPNKILTVTDGAITLPTPRAVIHVGLPYTSDIETLDIDRVQSETIVDKKKLIQKLSIFVEDSRGIFAGSEAPADDTTVEKLREVKIRNAEGYDQPVRLATEVLEVIVPGAWNSNGRIFIRQTDPLPLAVLAVAPAGYIPGGGV